MDTGSKLAILADSAKYDASCSTSGSARETQKGGMGNCAASGICHSWSADGRCVSILKVLLSNACAWNCAYCVNRRSNDCPRASMDPEELVRLIMDFYRRNYIEGAFLSSAVLGGPDATMERMIAVAKTLRVRERFNGYLHLKVIPGASEELVQEAAQWADRVSVNIELPSSASLAALAPDKNPAAIFKPMRVLARASGFEPRRIVHASQHSMAIGRSENTHNPAATQKTETMPAPAQAQPGAPPVGPQQVDKALASYQEPVSVHEARKSRARDPKAAILPAGQTTQMVIGASPDTDLDILSLAENLYLAYDVRRVYYSAFIPTGTDPLLPALSGPPLVREHRLYQADWLFRFYGYRADEILDPLSPSLDADLDPKCAWALRHLGYFPVDVNRADYLELLRVPGIGPISARRILQARKSALLRTEQLGKLGVVMKRARWFLCCSGSSPNIDGYRWASRPDNPDALRAILADSAPDSLSPLQKQFAWDETSHA